MATSQTAVFRHIVGDHMAPPPVRVTLDEPATAVVRRMATDRASAAVAVDAAGRPLAIATEQDVVRRFTGADQPARAIMTMPVLSVGVADHLFEAVGFMRRHRLRHMPVVDGSGALVGMLDLHDALAVAAGPLVSDIDRLTREDSLEGLAEVKAAQVQLAERLFADGVPAPEIQGLIADINNDIHARVLRLLEVELADEGRGPPPVSYACIVMGSGGRGESLLFPDQDHGFILADYPDDRHDAIDPWFVELATRSGCRPGGAPFPALRRWGDGEQPAVAQDPAPVAPAGPDLDARPCAGGAAQLRDPVRLPPRAWRARAGRRPARRHHRGGGTGPGLSSADAGSRGGASGRHRAVRPALDRPRARARTRVSSTSSCTARSRWSRRSDCSHSPTASRPPGLLPGSRRSGTRAWSVPTMPTSCEAPSPS